MENKRQNINDAALEYMEEKYGEKFEYSAPYGNSMTGTHQLLVKCASFPDQKILVRIENYKSEDKVFLDNYIAVKYYKYTVDFLSECANKVFGEANVFYDVANEVPSPELTKNATFDEYLADKQVPLIILVEVKSSGFISEEQANKLAELITAKGPHFFLSLVYVDDGEYGTFNRMTLDKQVALRKFVHCAIIARLDENTEIKWLGRE